MALEQGHAKERRFRMTAIITLVGFQAIALIIAVGFVALNPPAYDEPALPFRTCWKTFSLVALGGWVVALCVQGFKTM